MKKESSMESPVTMDYYSSSEFSGEYDYSQNEINVDEAPPQYFQAFEFDDIIKKMERQEIQENTVEPEEASDDDTKQTTSENGDDNLPAPEPSDEIINCIR